MAKIYKVPKAVEEAARRADEILAQGNTPEDQNVEDKVEVVDNTTSEKIELKETAPPEQTKTVDPKETPEYFQHRLKTVQGMWEADKRRAEENLARVRAEYENRLTALENRLKEVPAVPEAFDLRNYFDEEEIERFGNDLPKVMLRIASKISKESAERVVNTRLETELEPVRREVERSKEATQEQHRNLFWKTLETNVPDWRTINGDPDFHKFLAEFEPLVGATRQEILTDAETRLDANRVIAIFDAFSTKKKMEESAARNRVSKKELPDSGSQPPSTMVDNSPVFTASQVKKHYDDFSRGLYKNKMSQWVELERRIDQAYAAGRVSPG